MINEINVFYILSHGSSDGIIKGDFAYWGMKENASDDIFIKSMA
jgi:hypothetical protein